MYQYIHTYIYIYIYIYIEEGRTREDEARVALDPPGESRRGLHRAPVHRHARRTLRATQDSIHGQLLRRNVKKFQGRLEFKAETLLYHSTPDSRVVKKKKKKEPLNLSQKSICQDLLTLEER
jgi:hypothetical protein